MSPCFSWAPWGANHLEVDHTGKPLHPYSAASSTLAAIDIHRVKIRNNGLEIEGQRMGIEFGKALAQHRVALSWPGYTGDIRILIAGQKGDDFSPALDAIFAPDLRALVPRFPVSWELVGRQLMGLPPLGRPTPQEPEPKGTHVTPPVPLKQPSPKFSASAEALSYGAAVEVYLWVDTSGKPDHLRIVRPAGMGLDEEALASAAGYVFRPATQDGAPVKVDLYIDVNFGFGSY